MSLCHCGLVLSLSSGHLLVSALPGLVIGSTRKYQCSGEYSGDSVLNHVSVVIYSVQTSVTVSVSGDNQITLQPYYYLAIKEYSRILEGDKQYTPCLLSQCVLIILAELGVVIKL